MQQNDRPKRRFGDRRDGTRVRGLDGMHAVMPYLYPKRTDSEVCTFEEADVTELLRYISQKNEQSDYKITPFHFFVTAIAKTILQRPLLNRFVSGHRLYQRNEITLSFVVKRKFDDHSEETLLVLKAKPEMTREDFSRKIVGEAHKIRTENGNRGDDVLDAFGKIPRFLSRIVFRLIFWLDYHGWMPESLTNFDPNYATALLSNLGSIKCNAAYHHLNNYGTNSVLITIGEIHRKPVVDAEGNVVIRDYVNLGCTVDERIADGFYFAKSIKFIKHLVAHPEALELPIKETTDYEF